MKYIFRLLADTILEIIEAYYRLRNMFKKKSEPSLLASNILWCTNSQWMERLYAYKQLELWTADK